MNNTTLTESVAEWNADLAFDLIPNVCILSLYIILGVAGNALVILVYGIWMKKKSDDRYFIPILAASDLVASTVCASFGIVQNMMQAEFTNWRLCKALWFFAAFSTYMSVFLLLVIATHRYLKVCRPFGKQMTLIHKRLAVGLSLTLAIMMAAPTTALYGSVEFPNTDGSLVGTRCSKLKGISKAGSLVYAILAIMLVLFSMTTLIFFYSKIGKKIYNHFKYLTMVSCNVQSQNNAKSEASTTVTIVSYEESTIQTEAERENGGNNDSEVSSPEKEKTKARTNEEHKRQTMNKLTIMFMIITIVFLICYIPKVVLVSIEGLNPEYWENLKDNQRPGVLFVYRIYIVNNIVNPAIYAFMDPDFRQSTKAMFQFAKR